MRPSQQPVEVVYGGCCLGTYAMRRELERPTQTPSFAMSRKGALAEPKSRPLLRFRRRYSTVNQTPTQDGKPQIVQSPLNLDDSRP